MGLGEQGLWMGRGGVYMVHVQMGIGAGVVDG